MGGGRPDGGTVLEVGADERDIEPDDGIEGKEWG